jgi:hypothetical protein
MLSGTIAPDPDATADAWTLRVLQGAASAEAFLHKLAMLSIEAQHRLALHPSQRKADAPRAAMTSIKTESQPPGAPDVTPDQNPTSTADKQVTDTGAPSSPSK